MAGQLNYYVLGSLFGIGKKKRAAQEDIWKDLRSLAYFGICDCHYQSKQYDSAITACQKSPLLLSAGPVRALRSGARLHAQGRVGR
ncbi:MAG: hypothetical protein WDO73_29965 [Ignavibacteriota bacterium]